MKHAMTFLAIPALFLGCRDNAFEDRNGNGVNDRDELRPGLVGEYYAVNKPMTDFPDLGKKAPMMRRVDPQIDFGIGLDRLDSFKDTGLSDHFYVRWTGLLRVQEPGPYTFFVQSDDGARLYVDGTLVVDNGGAHPWREKSGIKDLKAGDHSFKVEFFENDGLAGCAVSWDPPGGDRQPIPSSHFYHKWDPAVDRD